MEFNWLATFVASLVPMLVGAIYYNPKVVGTAWMKATGMTEEKAKTANMAKVFGLSFVFSFLLAIMMNMLVIHQMSIPGVFQNGPNPPSPDSEEGKFLAEFISKYGTLHRTFTHGMVHGLMGGLFIALPIIGTNSLFEMKSWKYILINTAYWCISMMLMGGVICAWV